MMKVGVIGAGAMGTNHVRIYSKMRGVELVGISDIDSSRVAALAAEYGVLGVTDYHDLLKLDVDAVSIAVPTVLHRPVALDAIAAGTHVLVEKPIADNVKDAQVMISHAKKQDLTLSVGHTERFNPAVIKMKQLLGDGELGSVVTISTRRVGPFDPRIKDVGVILDIGVHDIDVITYLLNVPAMEVYAIAGSNYRTHEDYASMILRYDNDKAGVVEINSVSPYKLRSFEVIGTEGVARGDYMEQRIVIHESEWIKEPKVEKREPLLHELESFIGACENGSAPAVTGEDGLLALRIAQAAITSYIKRRPVKVPHARSLMSRSQQRAHVVSKIEV